MNKFHSTISRRNFMKGLGLAGAGLGAAAAATPVFHDIDELIATEKTHTQHNWWVKENDFEDITTPVDWDMFGAWSATRYPAVVMKSPVHAAGDAAGKEWRRQANLAGEANCTTKDLAIYSAVNGVTERPPWDGLTPRSWGFDAVAHQGTPEENLSMLRAALHYFGTPIVGAIELNEHMKRLFDDGKWVWEDIEVGFQDEKKVYHIPSKCKYLVTWTTKQEIMQQYYSIAEEGNTGAGAWAKPLGYASNRNAYSNAPAISRKAMGFVKALGYHTYSVRYMQGMQANVPLGIFSGLAEQGRPGMACSPKYGLAMRYWDYVLTDLPIAPTKPIDGGIVEFCKVCKRCAEICPTDSVTLDDDISWEGSGPFTRTGFKGWSNNIQTCWDFGSPANCCACQTVCPFNHPEESMVHELIRGIAGTTSVFNGFFANMDRFMGYGVPKDGEKTWWNRDLKTWKYDTLYGFGQSAW